MAYSAGTAFLQVVPSFRDVEKTFAKQAAELGRQVDRSVAKALPEGMAEGARRARQEGGRAGDDYSGAFATALRSRLAKAFKALPALEIDENSTEVDKALARIKKTLGEIHDQHIALDIDDRTALAAIRSLERELAEIHDRAVTVSVHANTAAATKELREVLKSSDSFFDTSNVSKLADDKFAAELRKTVKAAEKDLPAVVLKADSSPVDDEISDIRRELKRLGEQDIIGVDINDAEAISKLKFLQARLQQITDTTDDVRIQVNTAGAVATLERFFATVEARQRELERDAQREADRLEKQAKQARDQAVREAKRQQAKDDAEAARQARDYVRRDAQQTRQQQRDRDKLNREFESAQERASGNFARRLRSQLDTAVGSIRKVDLDIDPAQERLQDLRDDMERLRNVRIGVDVSAAEAIKEIKRIRKELEQLGRKNRDVQVRADISGAYTALLAVERLAEKLDGRRVDLKVDLDKAASGVAAVGRAADVPLSRLGAIISVGASIGPAIVPAAAAAAVAIGAIGTAAIAAVAGIGVIGLSMFGVSDAVKALSTYEQDAAKSAKSLGQGQNQVANALDGVAGAERALKTARSDAAFAAKRSAQQVTAARRSVTDAEKEAIRAQRDLLDIMKEVRQEEEDRNLQLKDIALAQRQGNLDVAEAKKELDKVLADPKATEADREQARITYEERVLQLQKLAVSQKRLQAEKAEADKKGVAGSDKVVAAQERISETSRAVRDAQLALGNALEDQNRQRQQSNNAILSATENLSQAQRTLAQAYVSSGVAGGEALDNLKEKMAALSPAGRAFALFIFGLKDEVLSLRDAAAEGFLPGAQTAITKLLPYLPKVRDYIAEVATAVGDIAVRVVESFGSASWQKFFNFIGQQTVPTLNGLATVTLNVAAGTRDLFLALTAFNRPIGKGLIQMTESFAKWAAGLQNSAGYQKFLAYVRDVGPDVVAFFLELGEALVHIIVAAAPVGAEVIKVLDGILSIINAIPTGLLTVVIGLIAAIAAGILILSGIMKTVKFATDAAAAAKLAYANSIGRATAALGGFRAAQAASLIGTGAYAQGLNTAARTVVEFGDVQTGTSKKVRDFADDIDDLSEGTHKSTGRLSALTDFIGGPFGIALLGATLLLGYQIEQEEKAQKSAADLRTAITLLGKAYKDTHDLSSQSVQDTIRQSKELSNLILKTQQYGIATQDVAKAAAGEKDAQNAVLAALRAKREELERQLKNSKAPLDSPLLGNDESKKNDQRVKDIQALRDREKALEDSFKQINENAEAERQLALATGKVNFQFQGAPTAVQGYIKSLDDLIDTQTTAAQKSDILRQMDEQLFGAQRNLQEALEAQAQAHRDLNDVLGDKNLLDQKGARALDINTEAGQRLTDALESELQAINETYRANVQNGLSVAEATKKHDEEVEALRQASKQKGLDQLATEKLIEIYGQVPSNRVTTFATKDYDATKAQLDELMAYQLALREGISLDAARVKLNPQIKQPAGRGNSQGAGLAVGGPVNGPGTGTSDSVRAWIPETGTPFRLSAGEWVHRASAVDYYGPTFMNAINKRQLPRELLGMIGFGFAGGGQIETDKYPFPFSTKTVKIPTKAEVAAGVRAQQQFTNTGPTGAGPGFLPWPSSPGAQRGDTGVWRSILNLVRASGIPFTFGNAYRPGDPLWHGSGRAVDFMGYNQDVLANFFLERQNQLLELIHLTPRGGYFVTRGKRKGNFPIQGPLHRNHLHVAMAEGGLVQPPNIRAVLDTFDTGGPLRPGYTLAYNGTGQTEQVLTARQMADVSAMAKRQAAGGNAYHFQFRDTTLDPSRLRAIQDREAALARTGRAR